MHCYSVCLEENGLTKPVKLRKNELHEKTNIGVTLLLSEPSGG
jgi:hypothetical protein